MRAAHDPDPHKIARFAELTVVPWRNGGGLTREVASGGSGEGGFDWRISIADVEVPGPFSAFPGLDRTITLVGGERMDLAIDGVEHVLGLHELLTFDGASQTSCLLPNGPTRDLNVMTRRDRLSSQVAIRDLSQTEPLILADGQFLVLLTGSAVVTADPGGRADLGPLDVVCPDGPALRWVVGSGQAAVVQIESSPKPASR
ncbi:MAG: HutD family protein [Dermatophilaceae bacterium]